MHFPKHQGALAGTRTRGTEILEAGGQLRGRHLQTLLPLDHLMILGTGKRLESGLGHRAAVE